VAAGGRGSAVPPAAPRPLGNVLVATDLSAAAARAVERAGRLPLGPGTTLTVLHVLPARAATAEREEAEQALARATALAETSAAASGHRDVRVQSRVAEGRAFVEIVRAARDLAAELVVVGRHGRGTFRDLLLGSTAERVLRKGTTAVLIVTAPAGAPYAHALAAVDRTEGAARTIHLARRLLDPSGMLDVVHAYETVRARAIARAGFSEDDYLRYQLDTERQVRAAVRDLVAAADPGPVGSAIVEEGDPRRVILDVAAQCRCDLLALGTHGGSAAVHVLIGSVAEAVVRGARCDVLVARVERSRFELP
jgi:nucleotide-binding universal stress UspA family protein